jgi:hypothetical protein
MLETNSTVSLPPARQQRQRGVAAVEFAIISVLFFTLLFGVIEFARLMFVWNTLAEVTRRAASAAASTDFTSVVAIEQVQAQAIFRSSAGGLAVMNEITDQSIRIEYMSVGRNSDGTFSYAPIAAGALPLSPADNRRVCMANPYSASCIRIVRARVCNPATAGACEPMRFRTLLPMVDLSIPLPTSPTLVKAGSFGL